MLQLQYYVRMKQFLPGKVPVRLDDVSLDGEYARPSSYPLSLGYTVRQSVRDLGISLPNIALLTEGKLGPFCSTSIRLIWTYILTGLKVTVE